jgi:hypothetical protein
MELKPLKVQAEIMWAFLDTPNQLSGKYQVDLCNLTKGAVGALSSMGVNVLTKEGQPEKGQYITAKSVNYPIKTEDTNGNAITVKVGNGSKGIALLKPYEYSYKGKKGVGIGINKLIVTDLVVYEGSDAVETADDVL